MSMETQGGMILTGKIRRNQRKNCPTATLSPHIPHAVTRAWSADIRVERPAKSRLESWHGICIAMVSRSYHGCNVVLLVCYDKLSDGSPYNCTIPATIQV